MKEIKSSQNNKQIKTDKEIEYEEILKVYREEPDELNFSVIIEKLNNIFASVTITYPIRSYRG